MRYLFLAFASMLTFACRVQKNKLHYQMLDCKNLTDNRGKLLKWFDLTDPNYCFRIVGGYCLLIHDTADVVHDTLTLRSKEIKK